jgi:hypothetical protein
VRYRRVTFAEVYARRAERVGHGDASNSIRIMGPSDTSCPGPQPVGSKRWTNHIDLMLGLAGDHEVRIGVVAVEHLDTWQGITIG